MSHPIGDGAAHELIHWIAALVLVVGGAIFLALAARLRLAPVPGRGDGRVGSVDGRAGSVPVPVTPGPPDRVDRSILRIIAGLSLGAGAIHLAAAPHHYAELGDLGAGFLVAGIFQTAWARTSLKAISRRTAWIAVVVNLGIVAAWILSRTTGLPVGSTPWTPEAIGLPDGAATVFELLVVAGLALRLAGIDRVPAARWAPVRSIAAIAVVPALGIVLLTTSLAGVAIAAGVDHGAVTSPARDAGHVTSGR